MVRHVIGVDGGNTKTDYFLFQVDGTFVDHIRTGPCSHEVLGFEGAEWAMKNAILEMCTRNGLTIQDVAAGGFGLAGIDNENQRRMLLEIIGNIGFTTYDADNDSFLGIIGGTSRGYGICSINGTGTVAGGVDTLGNRLQVGGIGFVSSDLAGGTYIARSGARLVYDSFYRCGIPTAMTPHLFDMLGITTHTDLLRAMNERDDIVRSTEAARLVFRCAGEGDAAALSLLEEVGLCLAKSSAGCARNLVFDEEIEVVLAGSVWVKADNPILIDIYKRHMAELLPDKKLDIKTLQVPPATGAVLWALSLLDIDCYQENIKGKVMQAVMARL